MVIVQATEAPQDKKHRHTTGSNSATVPYGAGTSTGNSTTYMYTINSQWCVHKGIELWQLWYANKASKALDRKLIDSIYYQY